MAKTATTTKTATKTAGRAKALRPADSNKAAMAKLQREHKAAVAAGDTKLGYRIYYQIRKLRGAFDKGAAKPAATPPKAPDAPAAVVVPVAPVMPATQLVAVRTPSDAVAPSDVASALKVLLATHAHKAKSHPTSDPSGLGYDKGYADGLREALAMLGIATK